MTTAHWKPGTLHIEDVGGSLINVAQCQHCWQEIFLDPLAPEPEWQARWRHTATDLPECYDLEDPGLLHDRVEEHEWPGR